MWQKLTFILCLCVVSTTTYANRYQPYQMYPHIDYLQAAYLYVEDDAVDGGKINGSAFNIELQKTLSESFYTRFGFQRYEDKDNEVRIDDAHVNLGYVFYGVKNIAHTVEIGATRSSINAIEAPLGMSLTRYRAGYRFFWHVSYAWEFDTHLYYFGDSDSEFLTQV